MAKNKQKPAAAAGARKKPKARTKEVPIAGGLSKKASVASGVMHPDVWEHPGQATMGTLARAKLRIESEKAGSATRGADASERRMGNTQVWDKARAVCSKTRAKLCRRKGVVAVRVTHRIDQDGRPTGMPEITIEVQEKLAESALRANQIFPKELDGIPVSVIDIRGRVTSGDMLDSIHDPPIELASESPPPIAGGAPGPTLVGAGSAIVPIDNSGGVVRTLSGSGTLCVVVFQDDPSMTRFFLTCSHVIASSNSALNDGALVGALDQPSLGIPPIGTTVRFPIRGHDEDNDCALIRPNLAAIPVDMQILFMIPNPLVPPNPPFSPTRPGTTDTTYRHH